MKKLFRSINDSLKRAAQKLIAPLIFLTALVLILNLFSPLLFKNHEFIWKKTVLINEFIGGLALFLIGLEYMGHYTRKCAGESMRAILATFAGNPVKGLLTGGLVTSVIQSSAATVIMLLSFVQAQMMTFYQTLGVILGADIGTTVTAWLVSFKLTGFAPTFIGLGFIMSLFFKKSKLGYLGAAIIGFGALFLGIQMMGAAMVPLQNAKLIVSISRSLETPYIGWLYGIIIGTIITSLLQSSSATTGIIVTMAGSGIITLSACLPIILGANIGSCFPTGIAALKYSRNAKRVALAHVIFKFAGVILFFFFIPWFGYLVEAIGINLSLVIKQQVAAAHTIFNVVMALLFLPLLRLFSRLIYKLLPVKNDEKEISLINTKLDYGFIRNNMIGTALDQVRVRTAEMLKLIDQMLSAIIVPFISDEKFIRKDQTLSEEEKELFIKAIPKQDERYPGWTLLEGISRREDAIDEMEAETKEYLLKIVMQEMGDELSAKKAQSLIIVSEEIEAIGDTIHRIMLQKLLKEKKAGLKHDFSLEGKEELMLFHSKVCNQLKRAIDIVNHPVANETSRIFMERREKHKLLERALRDLHFVRLKQGRPESRETDELHGDLISQLKQVNYHIMRIVRIIHESWNEESEKN